MNYNDLTKEELIALLNEKDITILYISKETKKSEVQLKYETKKLERKNK